MPKESGFAHLFLILAVAAIIASANIPVTRSYSDGKSQVAGVATSAAQKAVQAKDEVRVEAATGQTALVKGSAGALSQFPLQVDKTTNSLSVTTPSGTKTVTVLPDAAVANMLASRVMSDVKSASTAGSLASIPTMVKLEEKNGVLGYEVEGEKKHSLFGLTLFKTPVTVFISAENGQVVETDQSMLGRILNRLFP